ncbi:hypothetical protein TSUD_313970 [Trifolium subterraneum]|uniref:Uncharacterized protein n=1 Tax=Trifolium subterraneum TaxID=3900 RepID=A0A2Z6MTL5_TRISU|nr:hypothetical protein TSUD_313970 [Trifolium subterraneum]
MHVQGTFQDLSRAYGGSKHMLRGNSFKQQLSGQQNSSSCYLPAFEGDDQVLSWFYSCHVCLCVDLELAYSSLAP